MIFSTLYIFFNFIQQVSKFTPMILKFNWNLHVAEFYTCITGVRLYRIWNIHVYIQSCAEWTLTMLKALLRNATTPFILIIKLPKIGLPLDTKPHPPSSQEKNLGSRKCTLLLISSCFFLGGEGGVLRFYTSSWNYR